jgi:hypothetical protein
MPSPVPPQPLTPGHKTTEFWLVVLMLGCLVTLSALDKADKTWSTVGITLVTALYNIFRALLKAKAMGG